MMITARSLTAPRPGALLLLRASGTLAVNHQDVAGVRSYEEIPGPKPIPIIGKLLWFIGGMVRKTGIVEILPELRREYGDLVKVPGILGRKDAIYIFNPEDAQKVFHSEGKWPVRDTVKSLSYYRTVLRKDRYQGVEGIITSQGKVWQEFRSKVNQPMMQPRSAKLYVGPINDVAEDFIDRMKALRNEKNELPPNFINELYKWSLESIASVTLDKRLGCLSPDMKADSEQQKMIDAVQVMLHGIYNLDMKPSLWKYISTPYWRKYVKALDCFTEVSLKYIRESMDRIQKRSADCQQDLSMLERLLLTNANPMIPAVMAIDMLFGGVDTTSHTTAIFLFHLSKNQDKQQKLFQEVKSILPESRTQPITTERLNEMRYLRACLKESMRVNPIVFGNQREIQEDVVLSNYHVPKGKDAFLCHQVMCGLEEHFPEPDRFVPERWIKGNAEQHSAHPFAYMPFGFGVRMCVGRRLAELEVLTLVAKIIRNFTVDHEGESMTFETCPINMVTSPLNFKLVDRE